MTRECEDMTHAEHLAWAKERALEYVDRGDLYEALASIASDLRKHPSTDTLTTAMLVTSIGARAALDGDDAEMRRFIEGFN